MTLDRGAGRPGPTTSRPGDRPSGGEDGLPPPRRYWALAAIWIATTAAVLDSSIANIALPTIAGDVGVTPAASIWVVNAYQIAIAMLLLPLASVGEIVGYRRVYMAGLGVFAVASLLCALSGSLTALSLARFVQGLGAAGIMAMNGALVRFTYPKAKLGRGIGYNAFVVAVSSAAGPSIAAAILAIASWRWLFAINVPLSLLSLAIGVRALPAPATTRRRLDLVSALLSALTFACVFLTGSDFARGHVAARTLATVVIGTVAAVLLVRRGRRDEAPLIPLDLIAVPALRLSYLTSICSFASQMAALVSLPFLLENRFGFSHVETGLFITPMAVGTAVAAPVSGRLVERIPAGVLAGVGMVMMALAFGTAALMANSAGRVPLALALTAAGVGFGLFQTPNNRTMLTAAPQRRSGAAAGMLATMRLVGQTSGAVIVASILRLWGTTSMAALVAAAGLALVAAALGFFNARPRRALATAL